MDVLSRKLSHTLRHNAHKEHLHVQKDGFVNINELLQTQKFQNYTYQDVVNVISNCRKKRFAISNDGNFIRANQGHSIDVPDLELECITLENSPRQVIHGTYKLAWESIKTQGLSCMKRQHVHFTTEIPGKNTVISGMRTSCNVYIHLDIKKAIADGYKFYKSANGVILSPGNEFGFIEPKYFEKVTML